MNHTVLSLSEAVSEFYNVPLETILSKTRKREFIHARQVLLYLIRKRTWKYCVEIAEIFPNLYNDHSGISRATKKIWQELKYPNIFPTQEEITMILELSLEKAKKKDQLKVA